MKQHLLTSLLVFSVQAQALMVGFGNVKGWEFNDLNQEPRFKIFLGGAEATLVNTKDKVSTVLVYKMDEPAGGSFGADKSAWHKTVIGDKGKVKIETTYKIDGEWRYYAEVKSASADGSPTYSAVMAVEKDKHLLIFAFQQDLKDYESRLEDIKKLYRALKIETQ